MRQTAENDGQGVYTSQSPTLPKLIFQKTGLIAHIRQFSEGGAAKCTPHPHPFFGKLTSEEWGIGMYKHLDHHFRQFGA